MSATAILVDDERNLVDYLARMLSEMWPDLEILGTAGNGRDALALAGRTHPDIAFLDIHMPGMSGLQVAEALPTGTRIVFATWSMKGMSSSEGWFIRLLLSGGVCARGINTASAVPRRG